MKIPRALTIAGSAAQGSGGLQADLKTFQEFDVYGMSVITAIVARNTTTEKNIFECQVAAIEAQFYAAMEAVGADVVKTGMLFTEEIIEKTAELLKKESINYLVVDPVMIGKMGSQLLKDEAIEAMKTHMFPLATIITPNLHETEKLTNWIGKIENVQEMKEAAKILYQMGPDYILVKGGTLRGSALDVLYDGSRFMVFEEERIQTANTSGAGDTYAAAIASGLAKGYSLIEAVEEAKVFVTAAIRHGLSFNKGTGAVYQAALRKNPSF